MTQRLLFRMFTYRMNRCSFLYFLFLSFVYHSSLLYSYSYEYMSDGCFTSIHVLTIDPAEHAIIPAKASGKEVARETVMTLAKRHNALAAINGGFWKSDGKPAGVLKIYSCWYGTPVKPRGAIGWTQNGQRVIIDRILTNYALSDCDDPSHIEVIPLSLPLHTTPEEWKEMEHIVGGTPVLIRDGNVIEDFTPEQTLESFLLNKHPRTAVGIKENGHWIFVVIDGRFQGFFGGMTMKELAELMLQLGCMEALNLDGGGSSIMVMEGSVISEPCGKLQDAGKNVEAVSDAILVLPLVEGFNEYSGS